MTFPLYIQKAVDLGLLKAEEGKITGVGREEVETVLGLSRVIEKIQPTTKAETDDTTDQEAIVLCRVLTSPTGAARELWSDLRVAVGVAHGQRLPQEIWSTRVFRALGGLIDKVYLKQADGTELISRETLISAYQKNNSGQTVSTIEFNQAVATLADPGTMATYGNGESEWDVAIDLLRQSRARATFQEAQHLADQATRSDTKLEEAIEAQQKQLMTCLGMLRGSVGSQGNAVDAVEDLLAPQGGGTSMIDQIMSARQQTPPVSTGITAMDIDMEGGVRRPGQSAGGRLFTLAARTGVGKTILGVYSAVNLAMQGLTVGFVSAELDKASIYARIWSAATYVNTKGTFSYVSAEQLRNCASVGDIESPSSNRETTVEQISLAAMAIQEAGGKLLIEDPWGADVDAVINSMRSMKAKNPDLRAAVIDHFHVLARHNKAPSSEAAMLEERAYKLMQCAKELEIDLIVLAQMNRVGMDALGSKAPPTLDQIRGTDALSHVSHAVWIVRKEAETEENRGQQRNLEWWHAKTRGRQAYWDEKNQRLEGVKGFIDRSTLRMAYRYSSVYQDETNPRQGSVD